MNRKTDLLLAILDRICNLIEESTDLFIAERPVLRAKTDMKEIPNLKQKKEENRIALNQALNLIEKQINQNQLEEKMEIFIK